MIISPNDREPVLFSCISVFPFSFFSHTQRTDGFIIVWTAFTSTVAVLSRFNAGPIRCTFWIWVGRIGCIAWKGASALANDRPCTVSGRIAFAANVSATKFFTIEFGPLAKSIATTIVGWIFIGGRICKCYGQSSTADCHTYTIANAANESNARVSSIVHDCTAKFIIIVRFIVARFTYSKFCTIQSISNAKSYITQRTTIVIIASTTAAATIATTSTQFTKLSNFFYHFSFSLCILCTKFCTISSQF